MDLIKTQGTIENPVPLTLEEATSRLSVKSHLLDEATKLLARMEDQLKGAQTRMNEQEVELRELREELSKADG